MGQGTSKPPPSSTQHVFTSETPVRFSQDLVDALQASPETDSTRAKDLELHIQSRVTAELKRLEAEHTRQIKELEERISQESTSQTPTAPSSTTNDNTNTPDLGRQSVQKEIESLKAKLAKRKMSEHITGNEGMEKAKGALVRCLREKDRRPLDCWEEVEGFKREVGRLERRFVEGVLD